MVLFQGTHVHFPIFLPVFITPLLTSQVATNKAEDDKIAKIRFWELRYYTVAIPYHLYYIAATVVQYAQDPFFLTKILAAILLLFNLACLITSICFTNFHDTYYLLVSIVVCGINVFLVLDIALLLSPKLGNVVGRPVRPEYFFTFVSIVVIIGLLYDTQMPYRLMQKAFDIDSKESS